MAYVINLLCTEVLHVKNDSNLLHDARLLCCVLLLE